MRLPCHVLSDISTQVRQSVTQIGNSESGIRLSKVDMPMCRIATTCCRVRSASAEISGQMLGYYFLPYYPGRQSIVN